MFHYHIFHYPTPPWSYSRWRLCWWLWGEFHDFHQTLSDSDKLPLLSIVSVSVSVSVSVVSGMESLGIRDTPVGSPVLVISRAHPGAQNLAKLLMCQIVIITSALVYNAKECVPCKATIHNPHVKPRGGSKRGIFFTSHNILPTPSTLTLMED